MRRHVYTLGQALAAALLLALTAGAAGAADFSPTAARAVPEYLAADLRSRVEALKRDVAATPTEPATLQARTAVLWDWANAYAIAGFPIHPDLPSFVARIVALQEPIAAAARVDRLCDFIDEWVRELTFREANPDAVGELSSPDTGPWPVDAYATIEQVYTVGSAAIGPGGGFLVTPRSGGPNTTDPRGDGYVTVTSSNPGVAFEIDTLPVSGMFADGLGVIDSPRPFYRVTRGTLQPGDRVTIRQGDRSAGSRGLLMPTLSNTGHRFRIWVRLTADSVVLPLPEVAFTTVGLEATALRVVAPSVAAIGEEVEVAVRHEDKFRNRATSGYGRVRLGDGDRQLGEVGGNEAIVVARVRFDTAGVHRIVATSADGRLRGESNPVLVEATPARRILWGETHGHSGFAEGIGRIDAYFTFAREDARLDFTTLSEHDLWMDDHEWQQLLAAARQAAVPGSFETFAGHEWTVSPGRGGHHIVLYRRPEGIRRANMQRAPTLPALYALLKAEHRPEDIAVLPHAHAPGNWWESDPRWETMVEVTSNHGTFEWLGRRYLASGYVVGFTAGTDDHSGHPGLLPLRRNSASDNGGLAAVIVPAKSRDAIFNAMRTRSGYATNGARMILDVDVNGTGMGQRAGNAAARRIAGRVIGTAPIDRITLVRNGTDVETVDYAAPGGAARDLLELRLTTESDPQRRGVSSRSWRVWQGRLTVRGARITGIATPDTSNIFTEEARIAADDPNSVEFRLRTRGSSRTIRVAVADVTDGATLTFSTQPVGQPGRAAAATPVGHVFSLSRAAADGGETWSEAVGDNTDTATLRFIAAPVEREREFAFSDRGDAGDNYFVRARQVDGGLAWSSPIWVGQAPATTPATAAAR
jgi:hypothetical protein